MRSVKKIKSTTIDILSQKYNDITMIALDVEGSELKALKGGYNLIKNLTPLLAICVYHKVEDFVDIISWIDKIFPGKYNFKVLHHSPISYIENVLYCIPRRR